MLLFFDKVFLKKCRFDLHYEHQQEVCSVKFFLRLVNA